MRELEVIDNVGEIDTAHKGESFSSITNSNLIDCEFLRCMILDVQECAFNGSTFADCNMRDLQAKKSDFSDIEMKSTEVSFALLHHITAKRSSFNKVYFDGSIFKYGEISTVKFTDCSFKKAVFNGIEIKNVSFDGCGFSHTGFRDCIFLACDFSQIKEFTKCSFINCKMVDCTLPEDFEDIAEITEFTIGEGEDTEIVRSYTLHFEKPSNADTDCNEDAAAKDGKSSEKESK